MTLEWATVAQNKTTTKMIVSVVHVRTLNLARSATRKATHRQIVNYPVPYAKLSLMKNFLLTILSLGTFNSEENNDKLRGIPAKGVGDAVL